MYNEYVYYVYATADIDEEEKEWNKFLFRNIILNKWVSKLFLLKFNQEKSAWRLPPGSFIFNSNKN